MLIQNLVRLCQFVLCQNFAKNDGNNPKLDLVNDDVHTKFRRILSIRSEEIERKQNSEVNQGLLTPSKFCEK